ncbi:MAG: polysaccharide deacetylase family protein [Verrucomicrobiaceae bacterium]
MSHFSKAYRFVVHLLAKGGLSRIASMLKCDSTSILAFHGLREDDDATLLDNSLHTKKSVFKQICIHLSKHYQVLPLAQIVDHLKEGIPLPKRSVAITFDDGYESNYQLAFPILRQYSLPATVFLTTGFIDRTERLWFHRLECALLNSRSKSVSHEKSNLKLDSTAARAHALSVLAAHLKSLPQEEMTSALEEIESRLDSSSPDLPTALNPMSWNQVREMRDSRLIDFGAHTHRHLILGRCTTETARTEITQSRNRIQAELGAAPNLFAYPNGQPGDYHAVTAALLDEAGFNAAVTMSPGFAKSGSNLFTLPRYGAPESVHETEATVSGTFETLKEWRQAFTA